MRMKELSVPHRRTASTVQLTSWTKTAPHVLQVLALLAMIFAFALSAPQARAATTFSGTLGSNSVTYPGTSGTQTGRLLRNGIASTCGTPKAFPGLSTTTGVRSYDSYQIINASSTTDACVSVSYTLTGWCERGPLRRGVSGQLRSD